MKLQSFPAKTCLSTMGKSTRTEPQHLNAKRAWLEVHEPFFFMSSRRSLMPFSGTLPVFLTKMLMSCSLASILSCSKAWVRLWNSFAFCFMIKCALLSGLKLMLVPMLRTLKSILLCNGRTVLKLACAADVVRQLKIWARRWLLPFNFDILTSMEASFFLILMFTVFHKTATITNWQHQSQIFSTRASQKVGKIAIKSHNPN